jgi:hypothetical protein
VSIETPQPIPQPGMAQRAIDTATDVSNTITEVSAALQAAVNRLSEAIATARQPGQPLSTISAITREAPLASLFVAFLFGVAVARRRKACSTLHETSARAPGCWPAFCGSIRMQARMSAMRIPEA